MKAKPSKRVAGIIIRSRKSIAKDGVVTVSVINIVLCYWYFYFIAGLKYFKPDLLHYLAIFKTANNKPSPIMTTSNTKQIVSKI